MQIVTHVTIPAPREAVWRTFLDVEHWPRWSPWNLRFPGQPGFHAGARFSVSARIPGLALARARLPCRVTALEEQSVICWEATFGLLDGFHRFSFEDLGRNTCWVLSEEQLDGPAGIFLWIVRGLIRREVQGFLSALETAAAARVGLS